MDREAAILTLTVLWVVRTNLSERESVHRTTASAQDIRVSSDAARALRKATQKGEPEVTFMPDTKRVQAEVGRSLLEIAESNDLTHPTWLPHGRCGAGAIVILSGMENLSSLGDDERSTLERLGLGNTNARMACKAIVNVPVSVSLDLSQAKPIVENEAEAPTFNFDPEVKNEL